jgi:hypothetical protein
MSAKLMPSFADRGWHVVSVKDPYSHTLGSRPESLLFLPSSSAVVLTRLSGPRSASHFYRFSMHKVAYTRCAVGCPYAMSLSKYWFAISCSLKQDPDWSVASRDLMGNCTDAMFCLLAVRLVRRVYSSATLPMPSPGNTSLQCEYTLCLSTGM